ncbi:hypothetical protein B0H17DRAFT_1129730 [Mycena rosella]|uniref:Uncharacterized protein n=1 Tax=Mycena rosella TaxID=1033263 RepID=A0AAD7GKA7_MYCRO|nr:hypothetical protein B0H17DRAFT_1129730 [Mycena rosella]
MWLSLLSRNPSSSPRRRHSVASESEAWNVFSDSVNRKTRLRSRWRIEGGQSVVKKVSFARDASNRVPRNFATLVLRLGSNSFKVSFRTSCSLRLRAGDGHLRDPRDTVPEIRGFGQAGVQTKPHLDEILIRVRDEAAFFNGILKFRRRKGTRLTARLTKSKSNLLYHTDMVDAPQSADMLLLCLMHCSVATAQVGGPTRSRRIGGESRTAMRERARLQGIMLAAERSKGIRQESSSGQGHKARRRGPMSATSFHSIAASAGKPQRRRLDIMLCERAVSVLTAMEGSPPYELPVCEGKEAVAVGVCLPAGRLMRADQNDPEAGSRFALVSTLSVGRASLRAIQRREGCEIPRQVGVITDPRKSSYFRLDRR